MSMFFLNEKFTSVTLKNLIKSLSRIAELIIRAKGNKSGNGNFNKHI